MPRPSFPTSRPDFNRMFPNDRTCFDYLIQSRWPGKQECPKCGGTKWYARTEALAVECAACHKLITATSGTVMHGSRQPLCSWLLAAWALVTDKRGVSATYLAGELNVKVDTAWLMLHKLRAAMVDPDRSPLRGRIEADATLIGGERRGGGSGKWKGAQQTVLGAVEVTGAHTPVRLRLQHVSDETRANVMAFLKDNVERGSHVTTDAANVYDALGTLGMWRQVESTAWGAKQEDVLPTLHMVFSNLKKTLMGTYRGAIRQEHLASYLGEFVFRFNRRHNLHAAFQTILGIAPKVEGPTRAGLYSGEFRHANPKKRRRA